MPETAWQIQTERERALPAAADGAPRQADEGAEKLEDTVNHDADQTERKQQDPDEGIQHQRQKGERPAHEEQQQPEQELHHAFLYDPETVSDAPYRIWGTNLESTAVDQLKNACQLPIAVAGALMPDAHVGYGLPIGGVLATKDAVIPYAVGVDIACRMKLSVVDIDPSALEDGRRSRTRSP